MFENQTEEFELNMVGKRKPLLILDQGSKTMKLAPYKIRQHGLEKFTREISYEAFMVNPAMKH